MFWVDVSGEIWVAAEAPTPTCRLMSDEEKATFGLLDMCYVEVVEDADEPPVVD